MKKLIPLIVLVTLLIGCSTVRNLTPDAEDPVRASIANATYGGIYEYPIQLQDGTFQEEPFVEGSASRPRVHLADRLTTMGALDETPEAEAAVLLTENSGGSGSFVYLAVLRKQDREMVNVTTILIGDRVQVWDVSIRDQQVVLDLVEHGPDDAACCPTQMTTRRWRLEADSLAEIGNPYSSAGTLSLSKLDDREFRLVNHDDSKPVLPGDYGITLAIAAQRFTVSTLCDTYSIEFSESSPGVVEVDRATSTKKPCGTEAREKYFLVLLSGVTRYGLLNGQLALSWEVQGSHGTMLFDPK